MMLFWEGYLQSIDANLDQDTCGFWTTGPRIIGLYAIFPCSFTFGTHKNYVPSLGQRIIKYPDLDGLYCSHSINKIFKKY